tara:strand:- start:155 stop:838 length:684 start_codon:yes stop_codon:yes gene_type:complete
MYKPPQDIITEILNEDIGIDINRPTGVNIKTEPEERDVDIKIQGDKDIRFVDPAIGIKIVNPNERTTTFEMNVRKALNGDLLIFDHADIDIVLMVEKKKLVAFPKDLMSEVVYGAESRLMEWMRKSGIIQYDSIQGGNVYGSLEGKIHESKERDPIKSTIYQLSEWIKSEAPSSKMKKGHDEMMQDAQLQPDESMSTELGEVPHEEEKGSIKQNSLFAPYLYGRYTY